MSTEAARNEMRFAYQYLEKHYETNDVPMAQQYLENAVRYIQKARALDPTVTLEVKTTSKNIGLCTLMPWNRKCSTAELQHCVLTQLGPLSASR